MQLSLFAALLPVLDSLVMLLIFQFLQHQSMLILDVFAKVQRIQSQRIYRRHLVTNGPVLLKPPPYGLVYLPVGHISSVRESCMQVVSMRSPFFDEHKRNVSHCAVIHKVLERIRPE